MNDFSELESRLQKLRPIQPSAGLVSRLERAMTETSAATPTAGVTSRRRQFNWNWLSLGLGLAAATAVLIFARINVERPASSKNIVRSGSTNGAVPIRSAEFVPADFTRVVYHTRDEGLRFPSGSNQPMRRTRTQSRETLEWRNPRTGASLRVTYPSDEVSLLPIPAQ